MPMVGHITQTGQIVATDFRAGNVSPNTDLCSDTKFNVMLKAIINNIRLIACCVYSKFFDVGAFR
jgi:hypothetical protein